MNYDEFTTKDSGEREQYASGMQRDTQTGKPRFELLLAEGVPFQAQFLTRVAALLSRGADKYSARNHELASSDEELERFISSGLRHMIQWATGETDEDHAAAVVFNLFAAESLKQRRAEAAKAELSAVMPAATVEQAPNSFVLFQQQVAEAAKGRAKVKLDDVWPLGDLTFFNLTKDHGMSAVEAQDMTTAAFAENQRRLREGEKA